MVLEIMSALNATAVLLVAINVKKMHFNWNMAVKRAINEAADKLREEKRKELTKVEKDLSVVKSDIKNLRMELSGEGKRQPVSEEYFGKWTSRGIRFSNDICMKEEMLDYIAQIGIKAIVSELPEEARTPEIIRDIAKRMENQVDKASIRI